MSAEAVPALVSEHPEEIARCIEIALTVVPSDTALRVLRAEEERQNGFAAWLAKWRAHYEPRIRAALEQEFPAFVKALAPAQFDRLFEEQIWPKVEEQLRSYAILYQAGAWVRQSIGDAITFGRPLHEEGRWRVPLGVARYGENLGQVVLDENGTVFPELTSTRQQILEKISDSTIPTTKAATRQ
jgi:hypothetical protein